MGSDPALLWGPRDWLVYEEPEFIQVGVQVSVLIHGIHI